ncbi:MAG: hypothetical protein ACJAZO_000437 [Myxococcota bacterium]
MRLITERPCAAPEWVAARERLRNVEEWAAWLPGLQTITACGASYWMTLADAQGVRIRVELQQEDQRVGLELVEGSVRSLSASLLWKDSTIRLVIHLDLHNPLPGVLARELEQVYPARVLSALLAKLAAPPSF